ncbi:MAG: DUF5110 domain-containing protein, partial [Bacteroidota bacterium]
IIPMQTVVQHAGEKPSDTLAIHFYYGKQANTFEYYEDQGDMYEYRNGKFLSRNFTYQPSSNTLSASKAIGNHVSKYKFLRFYMHGFPANASIKLNGKAVNVANAQLEMMPGVSQFDPIGKSIDAKKTEVGSFVTEHSKDEITISW